MKDPKEVEIVIEEAKPEHLPDMVRTAAAFRTELARFQPEMWRKAEDADLLQRRFFEHAIAQLQNVALIARDSSGFLGFLFASIIPAPPVYNPGGLTCLVDDFAVANSDDWQRVGSALFEHLAGIAPAKGFVQIIVICPHLHQGKRVVLETSGFSLASEWWVRRTSAYSADSGQ